MTPWIAFLRGVNVGRAKRISMADLRALCVSLGHTNVRTVLNSGNVIFDSTAKNPSTLARGFESALEKAHGFHANTVFVTRDSLERIVHANPLGEPRNPAQFLIAFPYGAEAMRTAVPLQARDWSPDRIAFSSDALYLDAATGLLDSALVSEFTRITKDTLTTRNWATVQKVMNTASAE